uniref:Uncharacterized protein n=3 Tax=Lotharella globosa TaxID=91324 RepID=A0A7S3YNX4_9EUKA
MDNAGQGAAVAATPEASSFYRRAKAESKAKRDQELLEAEAEAIRIAREADARERQERQLKEANDHALAMRMAGADRRNQKPRPIPTATPMSPQSPQLRSPGGQATGGLVLNVTARHDDDDDAEMPHILCSECRCVTFYGLTKVKNAAFFVSISVVLNLIDFVTDIYLCVSLKGVNLVIQILATACGVGYMGVMTYLMWNPDYNTGLMFARYFLPFVGDPRKANPLGEDHDVVTNKRVVLQSQQFLQSFSEDGMTVINALLNGKKFTAAQYFAYGITAAFALDTLVDQTEFCTCLIYRMCTEAECAVFDALITFGFIFLLGCCGVLWGYFITLFYEDLETSSATRGLLYTGLGIIIIATICANVIFWKGGAGQFSIWDEFKDKDIYIKKAEALHARGSATIAVAPASGNRRR